MGREASRNILQHCEMFSQASTTLIEELNCDRRSRISRLPTPFQSSIGRPDTLVLRITTRKYGLVSWSTRRSQPDHPIFSIPRLTSTAEELIRFILPSLTFCRRTLPTSNEHLWAVVSYRLHDGQSSDLVDFLCPIVHMGSARAAFKLGPRLSCSVSTNIPRPFRLCSYHRLRHDLLVICILWKVESRLNHSTNGSLQYRVANTV